MAQLEGNYGPIGGVTSAAITSALGFLPLITAAGTYTPTLGNFGNIAGSTAYVCQYMRVGSVVTVSGRVDIDPTLAATATILGISLPIASNFAATNDCGGAASAINVASLSAGIFGDSSNDVAELQFVSLADVTNQPWFFTFQYIIK